MQCMYRRRCLSGILRGARSSALLLSVWKTLIANLQEGIDKGTALLASGARTPVTEEGRVARARPDGAETQPTPQHDEDCKGSHARGKTTSVHLGLRKVGRLLARLECQFKAPFKKGTDFVHFA